MRAGYSWVHDAGDQVYVSREHTGTTSEYIKMGYFRTLATFRKPAVAGLAVALALPFA